MNGVLVPLDQEAPEEVRQAWRGRMQDGTCAILGWSTDPAPLERAREIAAIVADRAGDGAGARVGVEFFPEPAFRRYWRTDDVHKEGLFVIYAERDDQQIGTQRQ